mmetsp:Transcript_17398/g.18138  ORF Transcript_17398/g.18138 Transcript_17398/m.18138 type:complete len:715 (+) Transcript_17398:40-2184(+)
MSKLIKNPSMLRLLRLQIKSGYLKQTPPDYLFLQRNPPGVRLKPPVEKVVEHNNQIGELYEKAIANNAIYADERVYPAYWQQEPQAFKLAKKQYQLMKQGLSEDEAFVKATRYVEELESKDYLKGKELEKVLLAKGANVVYASDESLIVDITHWRARLSETRYSNMTLGDQGQIDHLIQSRILKWQEVETERRMTDPIFYQQFIALRSAIFPEIASELSIKQNESLLRARQVFKNDLLRKYNVNESQLTPSSPFYLEDYQFYFAKVKENPNLQSWSEVDRSTFFRWIVNTLALREVLKNSASVRVQSYLEDLRNKFFPMIKYPEKAQSYNLPNIQELKGLLYSHDIGYKKQSDKVFVRRFYRLPALLFPEETFEPVPSYRINQNSTFTPTTSKFRSLNDLRKELEPKSGVNPLSNKKLSLDDLLLDDSSDDNSTHSNKSNRNINNINNNGNKASKVEELLQNLNLSSDEETLVKKDAKNSTSTSNSDEIEISDELIEKKIPVELTKEQRELLFSSNDPDLKKLLNHIEVSDAPIEVSKRIECREILKKLTREVQKEVIDKVYGVPLVEEVNPEENYPFLIEKTDGILLDKLHSLLLEVNILGRISTSEERKLLVEKYNPSNKTELERIREEYLQQATRTSYEYCVSEQDFERVFNSRQQFLIMEKAQMSLQFEERESARRIVDWETRGVASLQEGPRPKGLSLLTNQLEKSFKK